MRCGASFEKVTNLVTRRTIVINLMTCQQKNHEGVAMEEIPKQPKTIQEVFERIKTLENMKTDRELWEEIGISGGFFKEVKAGRKHVSEESALRIAAMALMKPEAMLVLIAKEKAATGDIKALWEKIGRCIG